MKFQPNGRRMKTTWLLSMDEEPGQRPIRPITRTTAILKLIKEVSNQF
jgi:hypothetical protein